MAEKTGISWADGTLNFWIGCTAVGPACDHCYAEVYGNRFGVKWGNHPRRRTTGWMAKARKMQRIAIASGKPYFCFSNSLSDIFDNQVPIEWLREAFDVMRATPEVTYLLLTKRPQNIVKRAEEAGGLPPNAAIGCTVVTQAEANRDVPILLLAKQALKAVMAFVSIEPILEPVDLTRISTIKFRGAEILNALTGVLEGLFGDYCPIRLPKLDWVIVGGESGAHARAADPVWVRPIRDACARFETAFHFKQWGAWHSDALRSTDMQGRCPPPNMKIGVVKSGRKLDGVVHDARPEMRMAA